MAAKLPAIQFYPGDWLRDPVSGCSLAAQGLWLRMMFLGHDSDRYGYLGLDGAPIPPGSIARRCGCTLEQYTSLLAELDEAGVPSRTPEGVIFSRRMVRDAQIRKSNAERKAKSRKLSHACHAHVTPLSEDEDEVEVSEREEGLGEGVNRAINALGIGMNVGPIQRTQLGNLIAISGYEEAIRCLRYAIGEKGIGMPACINYAMQMLASAKAKRDLKPKRGNKVRDDV